jgi:hypothetical protein
MASVTTSNAADTAALIETIYRDGIVSLPDLLPMEWADGLDADLKTEFMAALSHAGGTAPRGWNRFYFEPYPERLRGFLDLVTNPVLVELSTRMFGDDYKVVELGCDLPLPGAINQPWHRDFPMPQETREGRLTSIAVNASSVDATPDMGPFQIVPGTQFEPGDDFDGGMFPDESRSAELESRMETKLGRRGSVSVRSGLTLHRGSRSSNRSRIRPVAILGIVSPEDRAVKNRLTNPDDPGVPRLHVSQQFVDSLPDDVLRNLSYEVVANTEKDLPPHFTHHTFEGLKMSEMK